MTLATPAAPPADEPVTPPVQDAPIDNQANPSDEAINDALNQATDGIEGILVPNDGSMVGAVNEEEEEETPPAGDEVTPPDTAETPPVVTPPSAEPAAVTPAPAAPATVDPGEFEPGDYSFEVKTTDNKVHKVSSLDEAEALAAEIDDNPELISASQFLQLGRKTALMEQGINNDKQNYDKLKEAHDTEVAQSATQEQAVRQWQNEVNYLRQKGELPEITPELDSANWSDPKVAEEPAVKATIDLFNWMQQENNKRIAAGLEPMKSALDAHTAMQLETMKTQEKEEDDKAVKARKARGGMVGGRTSYQPAPSDDGSIVGVGGSLRDIGPDDF